MNGHTRYDFSWDDLRDPEPEGWKMSRSKPCYRTARGQGVCYLKRNHKEHCLFVDRRSESRENDE